MTEWGLTHWQHFLDQPLGILFKTLPSMCTVCVFTDVCTYMDINVYTWRERTKVHLLSPSTLFLRRSFHWTRSSLMGWAAWPVSDSGNPSVSVVLSSPGPQHCAYKNELSCLAFYLGSEIWSQVLMLTCKSLPTEPSPISPAPLLWVTSLCVVSASFHMSQALGDKLGILLPCISDIHWEQINVSWVYGQTFE